MPATVDLAAPMESGGVALEGGLRRILMASDLTAYADRPSIVPSCWPGRTASPTPRFGSVSGTMT